MKAGKLSPTATAYDITRAISVYNIATSFRLPSPALDAGIFSDSYILGD